MERDDEENLDDVTVRDGLWEREIIDCRSML